MGLETKKQALAQSRDRCESIILFRVLQSSPAWSKYSCYDHPPATSTKTLHIPFNLLFLPSCPNPSLVSPDCLCLPNSIPHQGPGLVIRGITAACGAILLVDQAFQMAGWVRTGWSGPGPLRLPGKSVHIKARRDDSIAAVALQHFCISTDGC